MAITTLDALREEIDTELRAFVATHAPLVDDVDPDCGQLTGAVAELVSGGKRLRAAFAAAGWVSAAGVDADHCPVVAAGTAFELFQAAALIHDDLIDNSDTRRSNPSTHRRIEQWHRRTGAEGDAEAFGRGGAILAGDLSLSWARHQIGVAVSGLPAAVATRTLRTWDAMSFQLMGGQFLDLLNQVRPAGPDAVEQARRVLTYKTVQYSVVQPLRIGATMADADDDLLDSLTAYGTPLGEAFQLRDDLLGVFGDPDLTGKPAGDDLREGKRTVLLALAHHHTDDDGRALLDELVGRPDLDDAQIERLRAVLTGCGAVAELETMIGDLQTRAVAEIDRAPVTAEGAALLRELAASAVRRTS